VFNRFDPDESESTIYFYFERGSWNFGKEKNRGCKVGLMANGNPEYLKYSTTDINLRSVEPIFSSNGNIKICLGKRDWTQITPIKVRD